MEKDDVPSFSPLRSVLWPIYRTEVKKVLSMLFLFFFLCTAYSLLRNLKDTVILTSNTSGAEVLPFLKVWGMLPAVFMGTWAFTKLCAHFKREKVFYIIISSFLIYFLAFAFILYPSSDSLHLSSLQASLMGSLPSGFNGLISMFCNWSCSIFYILAELWSVLALSILFWGFANDVTDVSEAKRSYGILNIGSNLAPILGGLIGLGISGKVVSSVGEAASLGDTLVWVVIIVTVLGILSMLLFYWMQKNILKEPLKEFRVKGGKKNRLSIRQSIRYLAKSKYLSCIALLVLGYNISINFTDILWKQQLKAHFTDSNEMFAHMNKITIWIGIIATHGAVFFSFIVRRFGWTFVAVLTPFVMTTMAIGFFAFLFTGDMLTSVAWSFFGISPLAMTVYFGSVQNCLSKAGKYSVFDASKELAFLPLDSESKLRGKAAIDGLGAGVGKSGASLLYQGLIIATGGIAFCTPYIAIILFIVFSSWIYSVFSLGRQFQAHTGVIESEEIIASNESDPEIVEG